jgi:hypothetical protein
MLQPARASQHCAWSGVATVPHAPCLSVVWLCSAHPLSWLA